jgi:hypothetical protein
MALVPTCQFGEPTNVVMTGPDSGSWICPAPRNDDEMFAMIVTASDPRDTWVLLELGRLYQKGYAPAIQFVRDHPEIFDVENGELRYHRSIWSNGWFVAGLAFGSVFAIAFVTGGLAVSTAAGAGPGGTTIATGTATTGTVAGTAGGGWVSTVSTITTIATRVGAAIRTAIGGGEPPPPQPGTTDDPASAQLGFIVLGLGVIALVWALRR